MKRQLIKISVYIMTVTFILTSCLKGDDMNTPPGGGGGSQIIMSFVDLAHDGGTLNSGLYYFGNAALTYPAADVADTATFAVTLQGPVLGKDLNVTLSADAGALADNFPVDSIVYVAMPDSIYSFITNTGVIKAGQTYAEFQVIFHPSKIDITQNFMLALTATNDASVPTSTNYGHIYFHTIGNPIAGGYNWDFIRCSTPTCSAGPDGQTFHGHTTVLAPVSPTQVNVGTGYFDHANYWITFKNNAGVLSSFKAVIDPGAITGNWAANGIVVVTGPTILSENNNTKFTLNFTTLTRNCTDVFYK